MVQAQCDFIDLGVRSSAGIDFFNDKTEVIRRC